MNREQVAELFHQTYEELAPSFGYETRKASAVPWADVPENNKALMVAVVNRVLGAIEEWRAFPVYVNDNDVVMCYANHDCEERSNPGWLPGRRVTLGDVVDAFMKHGKEYQ